MELLLSPMHASRPRNRLIAQVLYDMGVIEHYGRGIKRIKEECDRNGNPYPDWTDRPGEFLTIYKARGSQGAEVGGKEREVGSNGIEDGSNVREVGSKIDFVAVMPNVRKILNARVLKQTGVKY